ncbi:MAG: hypothetical protein WCK31_03725 [bacterium]
MTSDDFSKIFLSIAGTIGIVSISMGILKVLLSASNNLDDLRKTTQNMGRITDNIVEEQKHLDIVLVNIEDISSDIKDMLGFVGKISSMIKKVI